MKKNIFSYLLLAGLMSSCFFVNDILDPPEPKQPSLQERSEAAVSNYLKKNTNGQYRPYGFGKITIHKPAEIAELDQLEKEAQDLDDPELDTLIHHKKLEYERQGIERTIDLDHFFTVEDSTNTIKVFETNFILNDTLGVKDISANISLTIDAKLEEAIDYYFYEYNIFLTNSFYESRQLSSNFYSFFKAELERREGLQEKSAFLLHVIKLTDEVKQRGEFDQQKVLEKMVRLHINDNRPDIEGYEFSEKTFSKLYQTVEEKKDEVSGYYFFHKFNGTYEGQLDTNVVLVEFTPYYEISGIYQMQRPFDQYFKE